MPGGCSHKLEAGTRYSTPAARVQRPEWTLIHGFYALMGGFALDSSDSTETFLPESQTRAALTSEGLRFLLQHEPNSLPSISKDEIKDKSKADGLQKTLICAQALWFCVNVIVRLAQKLPISLLELNAVGHALCALLIYCMWWHKPLDIDEPTLIPGERVKSLFAYMWMCSHISAEGTNDLDMHGRLRDEFDALWIFQNPRFEDLIFNAHRPSRYSQSEEQGKPLPVFPAAENWGVHSTVYDFHRQYTPNQLRFRIIKWLHTKHIPGIRFPPGLAVRKTAVDHLSPTTITRWRLAYQAIKTYHLENDVISRHNTLSYVYDQGSRLRARIPNHLSLMGSKPRDIWLSFAAAGFLYGGLHMLAWDAPFSSRVEQTLWRISASAVTMAPLLAGPLVLVWPIASHTLSLFSEGSKAEPRVKGVGYWARNLITVAFIGMIVVSPALWFLYVLGRVYLVVESFKNLAHLPTGAFEDVAWPAYLPHIT